MPELPDVQVFKEYFDSTALHQEIAGVEVSREEVLEDMTTRSLEQRLKGKTFNSTTRHGKYLFAEVTPDSWLVFHFGMTGYLEYSSNPNPPAHTRVLFHFENGSHLAFVCQRLLGRLQWIGSPADFIEKHQLGMDALGKDLDENRFQELLHSKKGSIKSALMDQKTLAGLGNVYVDEILFQAEVHPKTACPDLTDSIRGEIYRQMKRVLEIAIDARVRPEQMPASFLTPKRGDDHASCPRCGNELETMKISGRTTWFCPSCQSPISRT